MQITMTLSKSTKGTHVYTSKELGSAIPTLYIKKESMTAPPPQNILVTFEPVED